MWDLLRRERHARVFLGVHAQSSLGTGIGYVALLLVAYDRLEGAWGITLVLLADFLPAALLGPLLGAAADRWSRRACAVIADLARAVAFIAIGLVSSIEATIAFALLAGLGAGLFQPAILAGLPSLVDSKRLPAAMSLYGAIREVGMTLGPAVAALLLTVGVSPEALVMADGITFLISTIILAVLPFGARSAEDQSGKSLLSDAREGLRQARRLPGVLTVILATSAVLLCAGLLNVVELLLIKDVLDTGDAGFSIAVALGGLGIVVGSALGSRGSTIERMRHGFQLGVILIAVAFAGMTLAPVYALALPFFGVIGVGNGLVLVNARLLLQSAVPDRLLGRVFGIQDGINSAAFGAAFVFSGALATLIGVRSVLGVAAGASLIVWLFAIRVPSESWGESDDGQPSAGERTTAESVAAAPR
jgi:MFS family permease